MRLVGGVLAGLLVLSACGDPATLDETVGEEQQLTATTTAAEPADTAAAPVDTTTFEAIATTAGMADESAGPLGGVTVDDPMPAQADADADPAAAETAVRFAYQHWILVDLDPDVRAALIENGEASRDKLADGFQAARGIVEFARIQVDSVTFPTADRAQVAFRIEWQDGPSPYFPKPLVGAAVFQDGSWRVGRRTLCLLALGSGQDCAGAGENPVSAASYLVTPPAGFTWVGPTSPAGHVGTGFEPGLWAGGDGSLTVQARALVGASSIDPADVDVFLSSGNVGLPDGTVVTVGSFPGRVAVRDGQVDVVALRDDDVVVRVTMSGAGATTDAAIAVAASMLPSDTVVTVDQTLRPGDVVTVTIVPVLGD